MARHRKFKSRAFLERVGEKIAKRARTYVRPKVKSKTLRNALTVVRRSASARRVVHGVYVPHYWAVYVNDGRRGFFARRGGALAWFPNSEDDPRLKTGHPVRVSDRRKLRIGKKEMRRLRKQKKLVFSKKVRATKGEHFFDNDRGMRGFEREASGIASKEMSKAVKQFLGKDLRLKVTSQLSF